MYENILQNCYLELSRQLADILMIETFLKRWKPATLFDPLLRNAVKWSEWFKVCLTILRH